MVRHASAAIALLLCVATPVHAAASAPPAAAGAGMTTLTVLLRRDESRTLDEINARLKQQGLYESFPPPGLEVLSWNVLMGIGQVVTVRFPAERLRDVTRAIEKTAWDGRRPRFYPTFDDSPTAQKECESLPDALR